MKITAHACLEGMLYEATKSSQDAFKNYLRSKRDFYYGCGSSEAMNAAKNIHNATLQRLNDLETAKRIIKEMEDKGVEI